MRDKFILSVGQAHQLETALNNDGWTAADLTAFMQNKELMQRTREEIRSYRAFINADADPPNLKSCAFMEHKKGGRVAVADLRKMKFHPSVGHRQGEKRYLTERQRSLWVQNEPCLNLHIWQHLRYHREDIPKEWAGMEILFWGTTFHDYEEDDHCVYSMYQDEKGEWCFTSCGLASSPSWVRYQESMKEIHEKLHPDEYDGSLDER